MTNLNIANTDVGNVTATMYTVPPVNTDGPTGSKETEYTFSDWSANFGEFLNNPHLNNAVKLRSTWDVGAGYEGVTAKDKVILSHITGQGKDTFQDILNDLDMTLSIGGNAIAQIVRWEGKEIINLKPLNLQTMSVFVNDKGIITKFKQSARVKDKDVVQEFKPEDILYLSLDRVSDEVHGRSLVPTLKKVLDAWGENFNDLQTVMHRQAKPLIIFKLKTDNTTKIAQFKAKVEEAMKKSTDNIMYIPDDENIVSYDVVEINPSPLLLQQKDSLRRDFYSTIGSPELLSDSNGSTESGGKIGYLAFEHVIKKRQKYIEEQLYAQLGIQIKLNPPASIQPGLAQDQRQDGSANRLNFQPNEFSAGTGE